MIPFCKQSIDIEGGVNSLLNDLYYKQGDIITSTNCMAIGCVTSLQKTLILNINTDKNMKNIDNINIEKFGGHIRHSFGGYLFTNVYIGADFSILDVSSFLEYSFSKVNNYTMEIKFHFSEEIPIYNGEQKVVNSIKTNNYLVEAIIENLKIVLN